MNSAYSDADLGVSSSSWGYKPSVGLPESRSTEQRIADVYQAGDIIDEHNLARRPRDWRADYVPRRSIIATVKGLSLNRPKDHPLLAYDYDGQKRKLNTELLYNPTRPPFYWDMRTQPVQLQSDSVFSISKMQQSAFQPPAMKARIIHPRLPWYIDVVPTQPHERHITVGDVFMYMFLQLNEPIRMRHYWNEELGERERRLVAKAFRKRCDGDGALEKSRARPCMTVQYRA
ncbi:hypothetical protein BJ165DRAFT_1478977 [Panaeolus papilionaceus]|nr:hypothetical protein BJ165DRAFT_1478977 [Panaeolus papilionaceus]